MDLSYSLCKFSPLTSPAINRSLGKKPAADYVSETESITSVVTRDIRNLAKSVKQKLKETSDTDHVLSDTDLLYSQSKVQDKKNKKMIKNEAVSDSDKSSDSESETEPSKVTPNKQQTTVNNSSKKKQSKSLNGVKKTKSPVKQRDLGSSSSDLFDSDTSNDNHQRDSLRGGNSKQSAKRAHSLSSNSSSSLSSDESESSLKSPKKKLKTKHDVVKKTRTENVTDISDSSDNDSDISSVMEIEPSCGESVNTNVVAKQGRKGDHPSKHQSLTKLDGIKGSPVSSSKGSKSPRKSTTKIQYEIPDNFFVDMSQQCLTRKDIKGKTLWLIMAPNDVDISSFHGQNINMAGRSTVNIGTHEQGEMQYEVVTQPYQDRVKTFNSMTRTSSDKQEYVVGAEIVGQIQVMNWIPDMPPVQITRTKPCRHTIPDNLKHKVQAFGSESPDRQTDGIDDSSKEKTHKHKKKKKKKDRGSSPTIHTEVVEEFVEKPHKHKKKKKKKDKS